MRVPRLVLAGSLLFAGVATIVPGSAARAAAPAPTCYGKTATQVMTRSTGVAFLTAGDDVVVGSSGPDMIVTPTSADFGGTDLVCGNGGDDLIGIVTGAGSKVNGGSGVDTIAVINGAVATGGSDNDALLFACGPGASVDGGSGDEGGALPPDSAGLAQSIAGQRIAAADDEEIPYAEICAELAAEFVDGNIDLGDLPFFFDPNDDLPQGVVIAGAGATAKGGSGDDLVAGLLADKLYGGSGDDFAVDVIGTGAIDCGSGVDIALLQIFPIAPAALPTTRRCEEVDSPTQP